MKVKELFKNKEVYATLGKDYYYTYRPTPEEFHRRYMEVNERYFRALYRTWWEESDETTNQAQTENQNS